MPLRKKKPPGFLSRKIYSHFLIPGCALLVVPQHVPLLALMKLFATLRT
jgi:hypothetical protein